MQNGDRYDWGPLEGKVANLNDVGFDVVTSSGVLVGHITTGDVMCDLGMCDHIRHNGGVFVDND